MLSFGDTGGDGSSGGREPTTRKPTGWREMATGIVCDTKNLQTKGFAFIKPDTGENANACSRIGLIHTEAHKTTHVISFAHARYFHPEKGIR
jgi:hypothetical protein